jgi:type I restriction enzyme M protein
MALKKKTNGSELPTTTAQALGALIKSARDIMRKDKGLNGDLDRLPLLTWIMFLKFLDDLELQREEEAQLARKKFRPAIEPPYRWRDWAENPQGITGDELLAFVNQDDTRLPDGERGLGLFAYLRSLSSADGDDRRDVIATVFRGVDNRMKSGYLLRDVINKVAAIHFTSSEELHTLGALYESMLREMRDAAGDSGEFYTPRPVVRLMVETIDPQLGETIVDPASGTGGFLVEAFSHLSKQVKTVADRKRLQSQSIFGCEAKSLPYLLGQMNLLLHGLDAPQIDPGNALRFKLAEIGEKERVDVILTNPPFGGEEEKGIQGNFPEDRQTSETALLFLQLIMRRLRRRATNVGRPARAAVVVPDGTLSATGPATLIRKNLLEEFSLRFVVQLPPGAFAPYAESARTNLLFFERGEPTSIIWYYQVPAPMGRKQCSKKFALTDVDFDPVREWMKKPRSGPRSWSVSSEELDQQTLSLLRRNPNVEGQSIDLSLSDRIAKAVDAANTLMKNINALGIGASSVNPTLRSLGELMSRSKAVVQVEDAIDYKQITLQYHHRGARLRGIQKGCEIGTKRQFGVNAGQILISRIDARYGAIGIVPPELDGAIITGDFWAFDVKTEEVLPDFLDLFFALPEFAKLCENASRGSTRRQRLEAKLFANIVIPWIPRVEQEKIVAGTRAAQQIVTATKLLSDLVDPIRPDLTRDTFGAEWFQESADRLHSLPDVSASEDETEED